MRRKSFYYPKTYILLTILTFVLILLFFFFMRTQASADTGSYMEVKSYETCLIREGDTLSSIAADNASRLSHVTSSEYMQQIMSFNNMDSEHIKAGQYLLLPNYI